MKNRQPTERNKRRLNTRLSTELNATLRAFTMQYLQYMLKETNIDKQKQKMVELDNQWRNWLRVRNDKYVFAACAPYFAEKVKEAIQMMTENAQKLIAEQKENPDACPEP